MHGSIGAILVNKERHFIILCEITLKEKRKIEREKKRETFYYLIEKLLKTIINNSIKLTFKRGKLKTFVTINKIIRSVWIYRDGAFI